jgi:hypothetical protein
MTFFWHVACVTALMSLAACSRPIHGSTTMQAGTTRFLALTAIETAAELERCASIVRPAIPEGSASYYLEIDATGSLVAFQVLGGTPAAFSTCLERVFRSGLAPSSHKTGVPIPGKFEGTVAWNPQGFAIETPGGQVAGATPCLPEAGANVADCGAGP